MPSLQSKQRLLAKTKTSVLARHSCALLRSSYVAEFRFSSRQPFYVPEFKTIISINIGIIASEYVIGMTKRLYRSKTLKYITGRMRMSSQNRAKSADTKLN